MATHTKVITDKTFEMEVLKADEAVLVDFWAEWCGPCRMVAPILDQIAEEQNGKLTIAKLNVDQNPLSAELYDVRSIPMMALFKDGKLVKTIIGARPKADIMKELSGYVG